MIRTLRKNLDVFYQFFKFRFLVHSVKKVRLSSEDPVTINDPVKSLLHPDKNPSAPQALSKDMPLVTQTKRILLNNEMLEVYRCCDLAGVHRREQGLRTCRRCDPLLRSVHELIDL